MVQNAMGATFSNLISEWRFEEGTLVLKQRSGKIDKGFLTFEIRLLRERSRWELCNASKKLAKKHFNKRRADKQSVIR